MATYDEGMKDFYELSISRPPQSSAQLVYFHLMLTSHCAGDREFVQISDRELGLRTRLSKQTITDAKRTLKNLGLIDFYTERDKPQRGTTYKLKCLSEKAGQDIGQTPEQSIGQKGLVCYAPNTGASHIGRTPPPSSPPFPPAPPFFTPSPPSSSSSSSSSARVREEAGQNGTATDTGSLAGALPLSSPETEMDIHDIWLYETGYSLKGSIAFELERLANEDFDLMHKAIKEAVASSARPNFNYVKAIFERLKKGGEKVGRNGNSNRSNGTTRTVCNAKPPQYDPDAPWAKYVED